MFFSVDASNGVPIYSQVVRQVKFAIAERTLRSGQLLPSVRQISTQLAVNPNTVSRAINVLQEEGVLESLRGRGMIVTDAAPRICRRDRQALVSERLESALIEALQSGLDADDIRKLVEGQLKKLPKRVKQTEAPPPDDD